MPAASQLVNLHRLAPEVILCLFGIVIMAVDPFVTAARKRVLGWLAFIGALLALFGVHVANHYQGPAYDNLISTDSFSIFMHVVVIVAASLAILGSIDYLDREGIQRGEYYALVLFAAAGMGILAGANELVTAFVGLEMSSISSYVLAGFRRRLIEEQAARTDAQRLYLAAIRQIVRLLRGQAPLWIPGRPGAPVEGLEP